MSRVRSAGDARAAVPTTAATASRRPSIPPVTAVVLLGTAVVSVVAQLDPAVSGWLTRDAALVRTGQVWRLATPILVQPDGWGQFAFNLVGLAVVGAALERRVRPTAWLAVYLTAGVGSIVLLTLLRPGDRGGGSSDGVAGLVGALAVLTVAGARPPRALLEVVALGYGVFFCAYLCVLDLAGVWPAMIAGDVGVAAVLTARRHLGPARVTTGVLALVVVAGAVMAVQPDGHGIGLLAGAALAAVVRHRTRPSAPV